MFFPWYFIFCYVTQPCLLPTSTSRATKAVSAAAHRRNGESPVSKSLSEAKPTKNKEERYVFPSHLLPGRGDVTCYRWNASREAWLPCGQTPSKADDEEQAILLLQVAGAPSTLPGLCMIIARWTPAAELLPRTAPHCKHSLQRRRASPVNLMCLTDASDLPCC